MSDIEERVRTVHPTGAITYFTLGAHVEERPRPTFYLKRADGKIFAALEKEASAMRGHHELVGYSDGQQFFRDLKAATDEQNKAIREMRIKMAALTPGRAKAYEQKTRLAIAVAAYTALQEALARDMASALAQGPTTLPRDLSRVWYGGGTPPEGYITQI